MPANAKLIRKPLATVLLALLLFLALCAVVLFRFTASRSAERDDRTSAVPASVDAGGDLKATPKVDEDETTDTLQPGREKGNLGSDSREELLVEREIDPAASKNIRYQANETLKAWVQSIEQISNPVARERALAEIRLALQGSDPGLVEAGLLALAATRGVEYDRGPFRALILEHTESADANIRVAAVKSLTGVGLQPADVGVMIRLSGDSSAEVRSLVAFGLSKTVDGPRVGEAQAAALRLLDDSDPKVVESMLASIATMPWTNGIEEKVLALVQDPKLSGTVIAKALSPKRDKSAQVVDALLSAVRSDDAVTRRNALAALRDGVSPEHAEVAASTLIDQFVSTSSVVGRQEMVIAIGRLGTDAQLERLRGFLLNPMIGESERKQLLSILERLQR